MPHNHRLELMVTDAPGALERIVSVCRSRQSTIVSLRFVAGDRHRPGFVELTLAGAPHVNRLATERLARLVDVVAVKQLDGTGTAPAAAPAPSLVRRRPALPIVTAA